MRQNFHVGHLLSSANVHIKTFPPLVILQGKELPAHRPFSPIWVQCSFLRTRCFTTRSRTSELWFGSCRPKCRIHSQRQSRKGAQGIVQSWLPWWKKLEKLLPGEGCAIWFYYAEVYIIPEPYFFLKICNPTAYGLYDPIRDWTRKMLYQLLQVTLGKSCANWGYLCKLGIPVLREAL